MLVWICPSVIGVLLLGLIRRDRGEAPSRGGASVAWRQERRRARRWAADDWFMLWLYL